MLAEYDDLDGLGLAELVKTGAVSALELVETAIARIETRNPVLNAVVFRMFEQARNAALDVDASAAFAGVPFLVKDLLSTVEGVPTSHGNRLWAKVPAKGDWEIVKRWKKAGLIILGKTNTPEFGLTPYTEPDTFGPTRNPWNLERTPGGSSGGSGAAVAARIVPLASGGDGGGSIRIPASACGLFGIKPTRGRTPAGPYIGEAWEAFLAECWKNGNRVGRHLFYDIKNRGYTGSRSNLERLLKCGAKSKTFNPTSRLRRRMFQNPSAILIRAI